MSGPKVSQADIERRRRAEIERKRREELERKRQEEERRRREEERRRREEEARQRRVATAKNTISSHFDNINAQIENGNIFAQKAHNEIKKHGIDNPQELLSFEKEINSIATKNNQLNAQKNTEDEQILANIINEQNNINKKINSIISQQNLILKEIERLRINKELLTEINDLSKQIAAEHKKQLEREAQQKKEAEIKRIAEEKLRIEQELKAKAQEEEAKTSLLETIFNAIENVYNESYVSDEIKAKVEKLKEKAENISTQDLQYIKNFNNIELTTTLKNLSQEIDNRKNFIDNFNEKYTEYVVLCESLNLEPKQFSLNKDSLYYIESEIVRLDELSQKQAEDNFIKQSITEVMNEMGYQVIGDAKDTVDDYLSNAIYQFDENTAIALTLDTNGNISMEIGSLDDCDRDPDAKEAAQLKADMDVFCSKHKEFKERLTKKGINLKFVHELPSSVEYAQVFNLNDYNISEMDKQQILNARSTSDIAHSNKSKSLNLDQ